MVTQKMLIRQLGSSTRQYQGGVDGCAGINIENSVLTFPILCRDIIRLILQKMLIRQLGSYKQYQVGCAGMKIENLISTLPLPCRDIIRLILPHE